MEVEECPVIGRAWLESQQQKSRELTHNLREQDCLTVVELERASNLFSNTWFFGGMYLLYVGKDPTIELPFDLAVNPPLPPHSQSNSRCLPKHQAHQQPTP